MEPESGPFVTAILLAAGAGHRFGSAGPKQFEHLAGEPMFVHPLRVLVGDIRIDSIVVVLPAVRTPEVDEAARLPKVSASTRGGTTRQDSLAKGFAYLPAQTEVVLVHDAARPLVTEDLVGALLDGLDETCEGVIPGLPLEDAIKEVSPEGMVVRGLARRSVWRIQTPQVFRRAILEECLAAAVADDFAASDCSELLTRRGSPVKIIPGTPANFKITLPEDLALAEAVLKGRAVEWSKF